MFSDEDVSLMKSDQNCGNSRKKITAQSQKCSKITDVKKQPRVVSHFPFNSSVPNISGKYQPISPKGYSRILNDDPYFFERLVHRSVGTFISIPEDSEAAGTTTTDINEMFIHILVNIGNRS